MILGEPLQITQLIAEIFKRLNIDYMITGSLASSLHGIPRATHDVDIVADVKFHHVLSVKKDKLDYDYLGKAASQWKVTELLKLAMEEVEKTKMGN